MGKVYANTSDPWFDLTFDDKINSQDLQDWVHDLTKTYYGDANLDGEFNSADLVNIITDGR